MTKQRIVKFTVSLPLPPGATVRDAQDYVFEAVRTWRGSLRPPGSYDDADPGDPMWELDEDAVKVTRQRARRSP